VHGGGVMHGGGGHGHGRTLASQGDGSLVGHGVTLLSAVLYGGYAAQLKHEVPDEAVLPMPYLFGLIGLSTLLLYGVGLPLLHLLHLEPLALPSSATTLALLLNALLGTVLSNMLLARAMLLASPLVATVGLSLSIPLALASDVARGRARLSSALLLGMALVWAGFVAVTGADRFEQSCARDAGESVGVSVEGGHGMNGMPLRRAGTGSSELSRPGRSAHFRL